MHRKWKWEGLWAVWWTYTGMLIQPNWRIILSPDSQPLHPKGQRGARVLSDGPSVFLLEISPSPSEMGKFLDTQEPWQSWTTWSSASKLCSFYFFESSPVSSNPKFASVDLCMQTACLSRQSASWRHWGVSSVSKFCHLPAAWPKASYLISPILSVLISKVGVIVTRCRED